MPAYRICHVLQDAFTVNRIDVNNRSIRSRTAGWYCSDIATISLSLSHPSPPQSGSSTPEYASLHASLYTLINVFLHVLYSASLKTGQHPAWKTCELMKLVLNTFLLTAGRMIGDAKGFFRNAFVLFHTADVLSTTSGCKFPLAELSVPICLYC